MDGTRKMRSRCQQAVRPVGSADSRKVQKRAVSRERSKQISIAVNDVPLVSPTATRIRIAQLRIFRLRKVMQVLNPYLCFKNTTDYSFSRARPGVPEPEARHKTLYFFRPRLFPMPGSESITSTLSFAVSRPKTSSTSRAVNSCAKRKVLQNVAKNESCTKRRFMHVINAANSDAVYSIDWFQTRHDSD